MARWSQLYKQEKPVIFYWYTPQYLNQEFDLAEVELPEGGRPGGLQGRREGCRRHVEQYKCAYDVTIINKLFSKKFADSGSPAYDVLKQDEAHQRGPGARSPRRSPATRSIPRRPAATG